MAVPYFIKRHILRRNVPKPPPIIEKGEKMEEQEQDAILVG